MLEPSIFERLSSFQRFKMYKYNMEFLGPLTVSFIGKFFSYYVLRSSTLLYRSSGSSLFLKGRGAQV